MARYDFREPATTTVDVLELVIDESAAGHHGVAHEPCPTLGDVSPALDAWQCSDCRRVGRIDGAWVMRMWFAHRRGDEPAS